MNKPWGLFRSLFALAPVLVLVPLVSYRLHYSLPSPATSPTDPVTGFPQISESKILGYAKYLSEDIGYRTVGTKEHALAEAWLLKEAQLIAQRCPKDLECEVWRQSGSGSHRFDMMGKRLYKTYRDLSNIIVRVSNGTDAGKAHAILVNAHLDSTLPSPGAADDALSCGVMLEAFRVLTQTPGWSPHHSIIFLFNNAEESLQDGSHLYSTQDPSASSVRAVINLEAAGTTGPEMLFQATSEQMINAYSRVPRPFGTIMANEVFSSGILLSDTDFRQFEEYLNVTGLDMAIVSNSYLYHMRKDLVENVEPGVAQHMADNTLALLRYLTSPESPLPSLDTGYTKPQTVFFSFFGLFFRYSFQTARITYFVFFIASLGFVKLTYIDPAPALKKGRTMWQEQLRGMAAVIAAPIGALFGANTVAYIMTKILNKGMSWFSVELSCLVLYLPPALAGALASQLLFGRIREVTIFTSLLLLQSYLAFTLQMIGYGSAAMFYLCALPLGVSLLLNQISALDPEEIHLWTYAISQLVPLMNGTQLCAGLFDVFVPLTGRIGSDAPSEYIIASMTALVGAYSYPNVVAFAHRFNRRTLVRSVLLLSVFSSVAILVFKEREVFDEMHQKRLFIIHMENITTSENHLLIGSADAAPGYESIANVVTEGFAGEGVTAVIPVIDENNRDWDVLYPFSQFLAPYKISLPIVPQYEAAQASAAPASIKITAVNDVFDKVAGTRKLTLKIDHPEVIWTALAFDAHVLEWTLDKNPPNEHARHHVKEASFYGVDTWSFDLVYKIPPSTPESPSSHLLKIHFSGIKEKAMWPGKKSEKDKGGRAMALFEDLDDYVDKKFGGTVDVLLMGCLGGVVTV
ncbi:hypothetical protein BDM02DRAFT_3121775 [Thelephora ganbajun]|uniref:Uncharacterized protein n=1 Tax=Thelephora ganbajun TaxID=370292 RepID=A0ACB6Z4T0_THEGA|nr:hypothetical protein BDM02DRAFT_3121775 [Thelephora ganbajun]